MTNRKRYSPEFKREALKRASEEDRFVNPNFRLITPLGVISARKTPEQQASPSGGGMASVWAELKRRTSSRSPVIYAGMF